MQQFDPDYRNNGFLFIPSFLTAGETGHLTSSLDSGEGMSAGDRRLLDFGWCRDLAVLIRDRLEKQGLIPAGYVAILCTLFDKSVDANWGVAPHRDLSVPVRSEAALPGWRNQTVKQNIPHAQPPREFLDLLFAIRLNVDACNRGNGALLVAPASHRNESASEPNLLLEGAAGDAVMLSPLLLHASRKSATGKRRRVLHFLFGPDLDDNQASWYYAV